MFIDEKMFDEDGQFNSKNDVVYAEHKEEAVLNGSLHTMQKYPYKVILWL